ncbi:uncharacterized protein BDR25DRAFT_353718 [Lindgomyces ingoldianus]|uniref:Uncharacterized protein n=1 Tax=Lindgomyces ingoldianus TaxID=673940 RepID=A0ACB6QYS3_9PLEO|nr:uncharacterized protein BDR25DRAFT_353718 [Lindgomyces ingoldianus]KAF2471947.1 hypothetical protein BDR25DRAFT_353718 [Lindgomyces ingoldianus]
MNRDMARGFINTLMVCGSRKGTAQDIWQINSALVVFRTSPKSGHSSLNAQLQVYRNAIGISVLYALLMWAKLHENSLQEAMNPIPSGNLSQSQSSENGQVSGVKRAQESAKDRTRPGPSIQLVTFNSSRKNVVLRPFGLEPNGVLVEKKFEDVKVITKGLKRSSQQAFGIRAYYFNSVQLPIGGAVAVKKGTDADKRAIVKAP